MNEQRTTVFLDRYALKDDEGQPVEETVDEMWDRVAKGIADSPKQEAKFRDILQDFRFVPGGRILAGAGTDTEVTFYNCYVIPIETRARRQSRGTTSEGYRIEGDSGSDSREAILDTISVMVDIMSRGGGVGINWSVLRPKGAHLSRVNGTTSGPVSWMDVASNAVQTVTQGGSRRGAAMFMLDDWHPDLMEFIDAKRNLDKITGANVSVSVSDAFMKALENDEDWEFVFPDTKHPMYNAVWDGDIAKWRAEYSERAVVGYGTRPAREVWRAISQAAWNNGEPGVVFLDRYNNQSTGLGIERIICVNPCGEQGLGPYSVCNLGSMNLDAYLIKKKSYAPVGTFKYTFDWASFMADAETATEFLDNVVDKNYYFLPDNKNVQLRLRRIGLGVMGLADAMLALGIRYGSNQSVEFTDKVFHSLKVAAVRRSVSLAQEKGPAPAWDKNETWKRPYFDEFMENDSPVGQQIRRYGMRNMFLLTQAPTGSTSILSGVNSGIEPYFAFKYTRKDRTGTHEVVASAVEKYRDPSLYSGPEWVTSSDVTVEEHIAVQAAVQRHVDSSVSKTVNGPNSHTVEDVEKLYQLAYDSGLKGVAYFRDGNGREQVLYKETPDVVPPLQAEQEPTVQDLSGDELLASLIPYAIDYVRPDVLSGSTSRVSTRAGTAYVTVNRDASDGHPVEVFFNVGKAGSEVAALAEALGRLASLSLRKGATLGGVANQLEGVGGNGNFNKSIAHAISEALTAENARRTSVLEEAIRPEVTLNISNPDGDFEFRGRLVSSEPTQESPATARTFDICPECHNASLMREEGCSKCALCGFSAC